MSKTYAQKDGSKCTVTCAMEDTVAVSYKDGT